MDIHLSATETVAGEDTNQKEAYRYCAAINFSSGEGADSDYYSNKCSLASGNTEALQSTSKLIIEIRAMCATCTRGVCAARYNWCARAFLCLVLLRSSWHTHLFTHARSTRARL